MKKRVLSGVTSTGRLTIGNYLGAIANFVTLQKETELFIFIANLHGITTPIQKDTLKQNTLEIAAWYFACGIDQQESCVFVQSDILEHANLGYILLCQSYLGELERMTQFKDKMKKVSQANKTVSIPSGLLVYPTLMAADILLYSPDLVPVGSDQTQHLELTKILANRFNKRYNQEIFKVPNQYKAEYAHRIMSLQEPEKKMSKSDADEKNVIFLGDDKETIINKIKKAVTDSENIIKYDPENKKGISNLLTIYTTIKNQSMEETENYFKDKNYGFLKDEVSKVIIELLEPIQKKFQELMNDKPRLLQLLAQGKAKAKVIAEAKLKEVTSTIGLDYIS